MIDRVHDWQARLSAVIAAHSAMADYPGRCVEFARDAVGALYSVRPIMGWRERWAWCGALDPKVAGGFIAIGIEECVAAFGWKRIRPQDARDGHLAIYTPPKALAPGLTVVAAGGARALRTVAFGLHSLPISRATEIWGK